MLLPSLGGSLQEEHADRSSVELLLAPEGLCLCAMATQCEKHHAAAR